MKKYITVDRVIMIIIIGVLLTLSKCQNDNYKTTLSRNMNDIDSIKNKYGQTILTQESIITNNKNELSQLTDSIFNLKNKHDRKIREVISYYNSVNKVTVKDKLVPYVDKKEMKKFEDSIEKKCEEVISFYRDSSIQVPANVADSSKDLIFEGTVLKDSFHINRIELVDSQHVRFVEIKNGIFKPRTIEVQVLHTNSYLESLSMQSYIYKPPKKKGKLLPYIAVAAITAIIFSQ